MNKYEVLPDHYYKDEVGMAPQDLLDDDYMMQLGYEKWTPVQIREWFSGSAMLTATAKEQKMTHLPPVDYRYGFYSGRLPH